MFDADAILRPWFDRLVEDLPGVSLFDAHTHVGQNDPDGFKQTPEELLEALATVDAKALVFPMHEPDGYTPANDFVMDAVARSNGTLRALCRVQPKDPGCVDEARRCLDAGVNGIKLHPRAEQFTLSEPSVRELVAAAHEHKATVLIHAGRGIPALGEDTVRLSGEFPEARIILAHCAISDLSWLWRELPDHPNLYIDTAWWAPADVLATFALCPPRNVVWASDSPYGRPLIGATQTMRMAFQAGLTPDQLRGVMGGQMEHVLAGEPRLELGPPPGAPQKALDPLIERVVTHLTTVMGRAFVRADFSEPLALARLACAVGDDAPQAEVCSAVLELLDVFDEHLAPPEDGRPIPAAAHLLVFALIVARTPDVPIPALRGVEGRRVEPHHLVEQLQERVGGLEEADPRRPVVHRDDPARADPAGELARLGGADRRPVPDRHEREVDLTDRVGLLVAQRALAEVAEVRDPQAVEREDEDRVRAALRAGHLVVLGGHRDHLADRRLQSPRRRADHRR